MSGCAGPRSEPFPLCSASKASTARHHARDRPALAALTIPLRVRCGGPASVAKSDVCSSLRTSPHVDRPLITCIEPDKMCLPTYVVRRHYVGLGGSPLASVCRSFFGLHFCSSFKPPIRNPPPKELGFRGRPKARDVSSLSWRSFRPANVPAQPTPDTAPLLHHPSMPARRHRRPRPSLRACPQLAAAQG